MNQAEWWQLISTIVAAVMSFFAGKGVGTQAPRKPRKTDEK